MISKKIVAGKQLFLDDIRRPVDCVMYTGNAIYALTQWEIVRNYDEFKDAIDNSLSTGELYQSVSFDHDLGGEEWWEKIKEFENYSVSNKGNIRRDIVFRGTSGGELSLAHNPSTGSMIVQLSKDSKHYPKSVHRLVAEAFCVNDDKQNKTQVNHINGIRHDNRAENLEWVTASENIQHSYDELERTFTAYGENHANSVTVTQYTLDGEEIGTYGSVNEAGRQLGFQFTNIAKVARGERPHTEGFVFKYEDKPVTFPSVVTHNPKTSYEYIPILEKTGYECLLYMIEQYEKFGVTMPQRLFCHSMNPVGKTKIVSEIKRIKR